MRSRGGYGLARSAATGLAIAAVWMVLSMVGPAASKGGKETKDACFAEWTEPTARANACTAILEDATDSRDVFRALMSRARGYRQLMQDDPKSNSKLAIADLEKAAELNVDNAAALYDLAMTYGQSGKYVDAMNTLGAVILLDPDNYDAYVSRGLFKLAIFKTRSGLDRMTPSQASSAASDFDAAIRLRPDNAKAYRGRASTRALSGDFAGSVEDYSRAIRIDPGDGEAFALRGGVWKDQGDFPRALDDYTVALRFDPRNTDWLKGRGDVYLKLEHFPIT